MGTQLLTQAVPKSAVVIKVTDVFAVKGGPDTGKKIL